MNKDKIYTLKSGVKCFITKKQINFRRVKILFHKKNMVKICPVNFLDEPVEQIRYWINKKELY